MKAPILISIYAIFALCQIFSAYFWAQTIITPSISSGYKKNIFLFSRAKITRFIMDKVENLFSQFHTTIWTFLGIKHITGEMT